MSVFFGGRLLVTPQSASLLDDSKMANNNLSVGNIAAFIGRADGGEPFKALRFGSYAEAKAVLKGDDNVLKAIEKAFDPSAETAGPSMIVYIRINPATQSGYVLKDAASKPSINLTSSDYGRRNNQIKVKVESGSVSGKKLTTQFGNDYYSKDNVSRVPFDVEYTGAGASATVTISGTQAIMSAAGAAVATIELVDFPTVQELVDRINAVPDFSANVLDSLGEKPTLFGLDFVTGTDVKGKVVPFTAHLQACVDWINGATEGFINAARAVGAGAAPANTDFVYLSGASDGMVTNNEWQKAFDVLQQEDVQWITPMSPLPAIHAMTDTHVAFVSNVSKRKRRAICGGDTGMSDDEGAQAAKALGSDRTSTIHLGAYDYNSKNQLALYPGYVVAASMSGMFSGVNPGEALTNKTTKWRGLERKLRNPTDTDRMILAGVFCLEETDEGVKVVKSISTWRANENYNRVEQSVGVACDYTLRSVQEAADKARGKKGTPRTMQNVLEMAEAKLKELAKPEPMGPGILVGDDNNPAYRKLSVSLDGDVVRLEYECSPVVPANYILQVAHAQPYSGSASV